MKNKTSPQTISEIVTLFDCIFKLADTGIHGIEYFEDARIIRINYFNYSRVINIAGTSNEELLREIFSNVAEIFPSYTYRAAWLDWISRKFRNR